MAYEKQNFTNGMVLDAKHLNNMQDAILELYSMAQNNATRGLTGNVGEFIVVAATDSKGTVTATKTESLTRAEEVSF